MTFFLSILLALIWLAITAEYTLSNTLFGFAIAILVVSLGNHTLPSQLIELSTRNLKSPIYYLRWFIKLLRFSGFFLLELLKASIDVVRIIFNPSRLRPGVIAVPLSLTQDVQITLLANLITLTPGTLSLEVSADKKTIFVHSIDVTDPAAFREEIKNGFEKRVLEVIP